ncbi:hypothetical protein [Mycoplasma procyoni]|nr:hypothetical protein [Mycoplasma procyoni]MBN3534373.1 hypothetical protein [Mycoplasma procyoni]
MKTKRLKKEENQIKNWEEIVEDIKENITFDAPLIKSSLDFFKTLNIKN